MIFFKVLMGINLKLCMVNTCTDRSRHFFLACEGHCVCVCVCVCVYIYIYIYISNTCLETSQTSTTVKVLGFTAYKKLENYEGKFAD